VRDVGALGNYCPRCRREIRHPPPLNIRNEGIVCPGCGLPFTDIGLERLIEQAIKRVRSARTFDTIFDHTRDAVGELGFPRLAIVHSLWFTRPGSRLLFKHNFDEFGEIFVARRYFVHDPALKLAQRCNRPFTWAEMLRRLGPHPMRSRIIGEARRHGLRAGLTVPVTVPGEPAGCCSFATDAAELPCLAYRCAAAAIAEEAFEEARRIYGYPIPIDESPPHLAPRMLECLQYAVTGLTDEQIGLVMGAKVTTIRSYMADLRRIFGVCSRTELARVAQRAGLVGIEDPIP